jgi:hypothetical protein
MVTLNSGDCSVALSGVCVTGISCTTIARMISEQFPNIPNVSDLANALRDDLTSPGHSDYYSNAQYRLDVAPVVIQRATQLMARQDCAT